MDPSLVLGGKKKKKTPPPRQLRDGINSSAHPRGSTGHGGHISKELQIPAVGRFGRRSQLVLRGNAVRTTNGASTTQERIGERQGGMMHSLIALFADTSVQQPRRPRNKKTEMNRRWEKIPTLVASLIFFLASMWSSMPAGLGLTIRTWNGGWRNQPTGAFLRCQMPSSTDPIVATTHTYCRHHRRRRLF